MQGFAYYPTPLTIRTTQAIQPYYWNVQFWTWCGGKHRDLPAAAMESPCQIAHKLRSGTGAGLKVFCDHQNAPHSGSPLR